MGYYHSLERCFSDFGSLSTIFEELHKDDQEHFYLLGKIIPHTKKIGEFFSFWREENLEYSFANNYSLFSLRRYFDKNYSISFLKIYQTFQTLNHEKNSSFGLVFWEDSNSTWFNNFFFDYPTCLGPRIKSEFCLD